MFLNKKITRLRRKENKDKYGFKKDDRINKRAFVTVLYVELKEFLYRK